MTALPVVQQQGPEQLLTAPVRPDVTESAHVFKKFVGDDAAELCTEIPGTAWVISRLSDAGRHREAASFASRLYSRSSEFMTVVARAFLQQSDAVLSLRDIVNRQAGKLAAVQEHSDGLVRENAMLTQRVNDLTNRVSALSSDNQRLQNENKRLRDDLQRVDSENQQLRAENRKLGQLVDQLSIDVHEHKAVANDMKQRIAALEDDNRLLRRDNETLKADNEALKAELATIKAEHATTKAELATTKAELASTKADLALLASQLEALRAEFAAFRAEVRAATTTTHQA